MVFHDTLDNGIKVVSEPMEHFRSVSLGVWVKSGSVYENKKEAGSSHFIEHMLFKGTARRTAADIASEMDAVGGNLNAFTAKECTCFYAKVLGEHIGRAADMLSDIITSSLFDADDIAREKGVVTEEIAMTDDSPEDVAHEALCSLIFEGKPLAGAILGSRESVRGFTRESLLGYMGNRYLASNMVIACAGNFERSALIDSLAPFKRIGQGGGGSISSVPERARRLKVVEKDIEQAHICMGFPGFSSEDKRRYALFILNNALGGSMSSRLFQKIREDKGLAYSVYSYPTSYADAGYFAMYAGTGAATAPLVVELMLKEMELLKREGITEDELARSKAQLKGNFMMEQESTSARCSAIGKGELLRGSVMSEEEVIRGIEGVTMDAVRDVIADVFDMDAMCVSFVGRRDGSEKETCKRLNMEEKA